MNTKVGSFPSLESQDKESDPCENGIAVLSSKAVFSSRWNDDLGMKNVDLEVAFLREITHLLGA